MSMGELQADLLKFLSAGRTDQKAIIERLGRFYSEYGSKMIQKWRNASNKKNSLLHEFVEREMSDVIQYLILDREFDKNIRRDSDGLTPFQLAQKNRSSSIVKVLLELGVEQIETDDVGSWMSDDGGEKAMNIVWMDLEMTSIEDPEILECAVIITDKNLVELEKRKSSPKFFSPLLFSLLLFRQLGHSFRSICVEKSRRLASKTLCRCH